ncbi:MAG TPA: TIM barrel protein [Terriglobales bacterium]|nr:TIM barrel protein [Terriglobales bacterium]
MESVPLPPEYPYTRVLDEIAQAGYAGTELGPFGFLPSDPSALQKELERRKLTLCSAFIAFELANAEALKPGLEQVERTAKLLNDLACHLLILSDEITAERSAVAGRASKTQQHSYTEKDWRQAKHAITEVLNICGKFGLRLAFHHHAGTHIETPEEIEHLFSLFAPNDLGLCLDTGHCVFGGGDPVAVLARYLDRLRCLHLKDIDKKRLEEARDKRLDFYAAVRRGVFAPLGKGVVDFPGILQAIGKNGFDGWVVVEQDVLAGGRNATAPLDNAVAGRTFLKKLGV